ncbi:MAG: hypothetical protein ACYC3I_26050, partial [Gemmataceae bacterium]
MPSLASPSRPPWLRDEASPLRKDERTKLFIASPQRKQGKELPLLALRAGGVLCACPKDGM